MAEAWSDLAGEDRPIVEPSRESEFGLHGHEPFADELTEGALGRRRVGALIERGERRVQGCLGLPLGREAADFVKSRDPDDTWLRDLSDTSNSSCLGGASGAAFGVGEGAELSGAVVADGVDPDDLAVLGELDRPADDGHLDRRPGHDRPAR